VQQGIQDMLQTLSAAQNCAALASTQLDIVDPPSIIVFNANSVSSDVLCLINVKIVERSSEVVDSEEGCMSVKPQSNYISVKIKRAKKIKVKAMDIHGKNIDFEAEGFSAICIQHEYDHLRGVVNLDHLEADERLLIDQKFGLRQTYLSELV
jgi:peptide deformylase